MRKFAADVTTHHAHDPRQAPLGGRRNRDAPPAHPLPEQEKLRRRHRHERCGRRRPLPGRRLRPHPSRRKHARPERTGNPCPHQGSAAGRARRHGDQKRRGGHHGPSHRIENRRLSDQACQPEPNPPHPEKEHPQAGNRDRSHRERLPPGIRPPRHADERTAHGDRMDGTVQAARLLGTGTQRDRRRRHARHATHAERRSQPHVRPFRQSQLCRLDRASRHPAAHQSRRVPPQGVPPARRRPQGVRPRPRQFPPRPVAPPEPGTERRLRHRRGTVLQRSEKCIPTCGWRKRRTKART